MSVFDIVSSTLVPLISGIVGDMTTAVIGILTIMVMVLGFFVIRDVFMHRDLYREDSESQKKERPGSYGS